MMMEFENDEIEKLLTKTCRKYDLKLMDHSLQVFAVCKDTGNCDSCKVVEKKK